ncbi:hypothetical protein NKH99_28445 [Mesorhizobium sp. M0854]|uniref:hypothetical protein n=1 Tax=Mesorhizobium sp. M0854 TaxID=2957013 RepID=UPI003337D694
MALTINKPKYLNYSDFETLLLAPLDFIERNRVRCTAFGQRISYEDIAQAVPLFGDALAAEASLGLSE